jgi:exosome complex component RRP40
MSIVLPGDIIEEISSGLQTLNDRDVLTIGPGLHFKDNKIIATKAGKLYNEKNKWWVENNQKRYIPALNDPVIGVIIAKLSEYYKVDIGGPSMAILPALSFDNATRRNRPNLQVGSLIFAVVSLANKDMEPELSCICQNKKDDFGELKDGYVIKISISFARNLMSPKNPLLLAIGKKFPFDIVVGINGLIWINADTSSRILFVATAIEKYSALKNESNIDFLKEMFSTFNID